MLFYILDQFITIDHFKSLDEDDIKQLIPEIGLKIQFKNKLKEYLIQNTNETNNQSTTASKNTPKRTSLQMDLEPVDNNDNSKSRKNDDKLQWDIEFAVTLNLKRIIQKKRKWSISHVLFQGCISKQNKESTFKNYNR